MQVTEALMEREADMHSAAAREDYAAAAHMRDAVVELRLRQRKLQLAWNQHARDTIKFRIGS